MQNSPSPFNRQLFSQKSPIIDNRMSSKYASDKLPFDVSLKETLTLKPYTETTLFTLILRMFT